MLHKGSTAIGLDVGGTQIRAARINEHGQMAHHASEAVVPDHAGFIAQALRMIGAARTETTQAVGIGIPGRVAVDSGVVATAGYLDIDNMPLPSLITAKTGLPCAMQNDATMALIAEARDCKNLIAMVTIGTGVGGALVQRGQPFDGGGFAGQFGHIVVADGGPLCNCGKRGCVETFCAGPALAALIEAAGMPDHTTAQDLLSAADQHDELAADILARWSAPMARALQTLVAVVDPTRMILGGGLGDPMVRALALNRNNSLWFDRPVVAARLGDSAGVIGAGLAGLAQIS